jgi:hypothetical protein
MMLQGPDTAPIRGAEHHGDLKPSLGSPAKTGGVVFYLMEIVITEAGELDFTDRSQAIDGHADGHPYDAGFSQWGVYRPVFPKFLDKTVCDAKDTPVKTDVFPQNDDPVILFHLLS